MEEERTRLQKTVLLVLAAMALVFAILTGISRTRPGVIFDGALLRPVEMADTVSYTGEIYGQDVTISVRRESDTVTTVTCAAGGQEDVYRLEYPLDPITVAEGYRQGEKVDGIRVSKNSQLIFSGGYDPREAYGWYDSDGRWDSGLSVEWDTAPTGETHALTLDERNVMSFASGPDLVARGSWGAYVLVVLFSALLALDVAFPMTLFRLQHMCDVRDPQPTDFYLTVQRLGWVVYPFLLGAGYLWALRLVP